MPLAWVRCSVEPDALAVRVRTLSGERRYAIVAATFRGEPALRLGVSTLHPDFAAVLMPDGFVALLPRDAVIEIG